MIEVNVAHLLISALVGTLILNVILTYKYWQGINDNTKSRVEADGLLDKLFDRREAIMERKRNPKPQRRNKKTNYQTETSPKDFRL